MKILFAGTTAQAARVLAHLATRFEICGVLTRRDAQVGRNAILTPSPVADLAAKLNLPIIKANKVDSEVNAEIAATELDAAVVIAYGALLKQSTLELAPLGWYNLHYSLLPKYRGAAPVQHALLNGETETGVTIFRLDAGMDTGDIVSQVPTQIEPGENTADLLERLTVIGITALDEVLPAIASGSANATHQTGASSIAPKLNRQDARLNFELSAKILEQRVRAFNPEPIAWCEFGGQPLRVLAARAFVTSIDGEPGTVSVVGDKVLVTCGDKSLELIEVQPAGKSPMKATDWLRGQRVAVVLK